MTFWKDLSRCGMVVSCTRQASHQIRSLPADWRPCCSGLLEAVRRLLQPDGSLLRPRLLMRAFATSRLEPNTPVYWVPFPETSGRKDQASGFSNSFRGMHCVNTASECDVPISDRPLP